MSGWSKIADCARNSKRSKVHKTKAARAKKRIVIPHFRQRMIHFLESRGIRIADASAANAFLIKMCGDELGEHYQPDSVQHIQALMVRLPELPKKRKPAPRKKVDFYNSRAWQALRFQVLSESNGRCVLCGASSHNGVRLHVDHIKPRSKYPRLELDKSNLQVLCEPCNMGKSNKDDTDWRADNVVALREDEWAAIRERMGLA